MWQRHLKKTIFTLNVSGPGHEKGYAPEITALTYPLMQRYAKRIGADFYIINKRKFPEWPPVYEKLQIFELAQQMQNDWNIFIDSDALIHPETIDFTEHLPRDTVAHNGSDMAAVRWKYDRYFQRDGRNIGSCNWLTIGSDLCIDLWKPLDDLTFKQAEANIYPTVDEITTIIEPGHLIDDYTLSRNIAKYGLKFTTIKQLLVQLGMSDANFFWHLYTISIEDKVQRMKKIIEDWKIPLYFEKGGR